jgi:CheY-like chemotaxis protein
MSTPDEHAHRADPRELAHDLSAPSAKLRLYAQALEDALPRFTRCQAPARLQAPGPLADLLPEIPARLGAVADAIDAVAARVLQLANAGAQIEAPDIGDRAVAATAVSAAPAAASQVQAQTPAPSASGRPRSHKEAARRVLLVEDDADSRELSAMMLEWEGWNVTTAGDGGPALALLERERFDLILMDCRLPELDGWTATERLRSGGPNQRTPVIGLTASPDSADEAHGRTAGMDDWIVKPLTASHIARFRDHTDA